MKNACPYCGSVADLDTSRGDLHPCPDCGRGFWALQEGGAGHPFETQAPRKGFLWKVWVLAVSAAVLAAEVFLAAAIYGGAVYAAARLAGA